MADKMSRWGRRLRVSGRIGSQNARSNTRQVPIKGQLTMEGAVRRRQAIKKIDHQTKDSPHTLFF